MPVAKSRAKISYYSLLIVTIVLSVNHEKINVSQHSVKNNAFLDPI